MSVADAIRFLRVNKVCHERRDTGTCDHAGCNAAVKAAEAVEDLQREVEFLRRREAA